MQQIAALEQSGAKLEQAEAELNRLRAEVDPLRGERDRLRQENADLKDQVSALSARIQVLEKQQTKDKTVISKLKTKTDSSSDSLALKDLRIQHSRCEVKLADLKAEIVRLQLQRVSVKSILASAATVLTQIQGLQGILTPPSLPPSTSSKSAEITLDDHLDPELCDDEVPRPTGDEATVRQWEQGMQVKGTPSPGLVRCFSIRQGYRTPGGRIYVWPDFLRKKFWKTSDYQLPCPSRACQQRFSRETAMSEIVRHIHTTHSTELFCATEEMLAVPKIADMHISTAIALPLVK